MTRLAPVLAVASATVLLAAPALAADYPSNSFDAGGNGGGMRSGFSEDGWANSDENDPLSFETGVRYWYSLGSQNFTLDPSLPAVSDTSTSQTGELYGRVNDASTGYYAKAIGGMSFSTTSSYDGIESGSGNGGSIAYTGADLGYTMLGNFKSPLRVGPFAGYMYWNDSPSASANSFGNSYTTLTSAPTNWDHATGQTFIPGDSTANNLTANMLRLGMSGEATFGMFDLSGEVAAVPYAKLNGVLGSASGAVEYWQSPPGSISNSIGTTPGYNIASIQSSPTQLDGWGYGAMAEALIGFHPTSNMTIKLGGRAWYLQGTADATYQRAEIGNPTSSAPAADPVVYDQGPSFSNQGYIARNQPWKLFRYGLLAQFGYTF